MFNPGILYGFELKPTVMVFDTWTRISELTDFIDISGLRNTDKP